MSEPNGNANTVVASNDSSLVERKKELCATCRGLGLRVSRFIVQPSAGLGNQYTPITFRPASSTSSIKLGTLKELYEKSCKGCGFCTLLIRSVQQSLDGSIADWDRLSQLQHVSCFMRWEVDGRRVLKVNDSGEAKRKVRDNSRGLTRRIHIRWDDQQIRDCYLIFVAREKYLTTASDAHRIWGSESLFLGRKVESGGNIQARVKSWLDLCREHHSGPCSCPSPKERSKFSKLVSHSYFGVIDVMNMQLTELPRNAYTQDHQPYAALSYVWGTKRTFVTNLKNVNLLRMHGGLEKVMSQLPQVIKDAIDLVRRLGLQYLWIDALCIIQDSPRSWKLNAYNMDSIYGNAELTICAADGVDAGFLGDCLDNVSEWLEKHTWIRWYIRDGHGDLRPLWSDQRKSKEDEWVSWEQGLKHYWRVDQSEDARWRGYSTRRTSGKSIPTHHSKRSNRTTNDRHIYRRSSDRRYDERCDSTESSVSSDGSRPDLPRIVSFRERERSRSPEAVRDIIVHRGREREGIRRRPSRSPDYLNTRTRERSVSPTPSMEWRRPEDTLEPMMFERDSLIQKHFFLRLLDEVLGILRILLLSITLSLHRLGFQSVAGRLGRLKNWATRAAAPYTVHHDDRKPRNNRHTMTTFHDVYRERPSHVRSRSRSRSPARRESYRISKERLLSPPKRHVRRDAREYSEENVRPQDRHGYPSAWETWDQRNEAYYHSNDKSYHHHHHRSHVRPSARYNDEQWQAPYELFFKPPEEIEPADTEIDPKFYIYPKECPYRIVIAPYSRNINSVEFPLMPILQFWTWHTWLNIIAPANEVQDGAASTVGEGLKRCHICDESGDWCGSIVLDEQWAETASSARQELIAISEAKKFSLDECGAWTYYIPKERDQSEWDLFYVLLIERKGEKWERVGLGKAFKEAFMRKAGWKEIMLG